MQTYNQLIDCDKSLAEDSSVDFMKRTNEIPTLAKLSLAAIDKQVWKPTWEVAASLRIILNAMNSPTTSVLLVRKMTKC